VLPAVQEVEQVVLEVDDDGPVGGDPVVAVALEDARDVEDKAERKARVVVGPVRRRRGG
jgi:hypothetical protein